jgi:hypothetical protein
MLCYRMDELELLLNLDAAAYEMTPGVVVEFSVRRTAATPQHPHGISYALVLRPRAGGEPWVRFETPTQSRDVGDRGARLRPTITGTGPRRIGVAPMSSRPRCNCLRIFGER